MSALEIMLEKAYDEDKKDSEADRTINRTKRALWLARAERAKGVKNYWQKVFEHNGDYVDKHGNDISKEHCEIMIQKWLWAERKCRAYADKFKEET